MLHFFIILFNFTFLRNEVIFHPLLLSKRHPETLIDLYSVVGGTWYPMHFTLVHDIIRFSVHLAGN